MRYFLSQHHCRTEKRIPETRRRKTWLVQTVANISAEFYCITLARSCSSGETVELLVGAVGAMVGAA